MEKVPRERTLHKDLIRSLVELVSAVEPRLRVPAQERRGHDLHCYDSADGAALGMICNTQTLFKQPLRTSTVLTLKANQKTYYGYAFSK